MTTTKIAGGVYGKAVSLSDYDDFLDWLVSDGNNAIKPQELYKAVAWSYWSANLRADCVASIPYQIYSEDSDEDTPEHERPFDIDLKQPLWLTEMWWTLAGCSYVLKLQNRVKLKRLQVLNPNTMKILSYDEDGPTVFRQTVGAKTKDYSKEEIVYFRAFDPSCDIGGGIGGGQVGSVAGSLIYNANAWAVKFFENGAIPAVFLTTEGSVPPNEKDRIQGVWTKMLQGVRNAFKTMVLEKGLTPTVVGTPIKDLAMPELEATKRNQVLAAHGIPAGLGETKTNRSEREALAYELWEHTLVPHTEVWIEPTLNEQLFNPLGLRISFHTNEVEIMQAREIEKAEASSFIVNGVMLPLFEANACTVQEVRQVANRVLIALELPELDLKWEPEPEPEPVIVAPTEVAPNEQPNEQGESPEPGRRERVGEPATNVRSISDEVLSDLHKWREKCRKREKAAEFNSEVIPSWLTEQVKAAIDTVGHIDAFRFLKAVEPERDADEETIRKEMARLFKAWLPIFVTAVLNHETPNYTEFANAIKAALLPIYVNIYIEQTMRASAGTGVGIDPAQLHEQALAWATDHVNTVAGQLVATTRKIVDKVWAAVDASPETETEDDIKLLLLPAFNDARAESIAITETTIAHNSAVVEVGHILDAIIAASGLITFMVWHTRNDERVCKVCGPLHLAKSVEWIGMFPFGPPAHVNCRCWLEIRI